MLFGFGSKKVLGLDIGTSSIKMAELDVSKRGAALLGFSMMATPEVAVNGGEIVDLASLSEVLSDMVRELGTKRKHVAAALWGSAIIVKKISVQAADKSVLEQQLSWEAEQYIPFDVNEVNLSYKILGPSAAGVEIMDVLLVAARHEYVFKYMEVIGQARLECSILDVAGFALANCFEKNYGVMKGQVVGLMNIGASVTTFVVVDSGEVVFCRDIPVGGLTYTAEIQRGMGVNADEAEAMKLSVSMGQAAPDEAASLIQNAHEGVCEEINASIDFFLNTNQSGGVAQFYLSGGSMALPGLAQAISRVTGTPCEPLNPFFRIKSKGKKLSSSYLSEIQNFAAIAVGLGLRQAGDS